MNLDNYIANARYRVVEPEVTKSEIKAFVLAEMSQALNDSQYLPEFVTKLTERVKSW